MVQIKCHYKMIFKNIFDRLKQTIQQEKHKVIQDKEEIASLRGQVEKLKEIQNVLEKEKEK